MIVFIASGEFENLGVGYISSMLLSSGYEVKLIDLRKNKSDILDLLKNCKPEIIGFSVIFQYHLSIFMDLIGFLRKSGVSCHFTAGGHYASLKTAELFDYIPELDSVVRFDGEYTMLELAGKIHAGTDWRSTQGIAYRQNNEIFFNKLKPLETDLDKFPLPFRPTIRKYAFEIPFSTLLAGRGCLNNCSFCNTRKFYRNAGGLLKRIRRPEMVVSEMEILYNTKKCPVFLFIDDDFPVNPKNDPEWVKRFCNELKARGLRNKIIWNIACRADEVEEEIFAFMKENGLFLVFLGIEDGTDTGLKTLNKKLAASENIRAINILKKLEIGIDFGFLLFQPETTFQSLADNLNFLRKIWGDGYTPVTFLKLMPYYETAAEKKLEKNGRLKITAGKRDYDFSEASMNDYYEFHVKCFSRWLRNKNGVEGLSNWTRNNFLVFPRFFEPGPELEKLKIRFTKIVADSNLFLLDTMKELSDLFQSGNYIENEHKLKLIEDRIASKESLIEKQIITVYGEINCLALEHCFKATKGEIESS
jgi:anaerobic magnesium-protoporphyrin IX monomethyl ester cyclase